MTKDDSYDENLAEVDSWRGFWIGFMVGFLIALGSLSILVIITYVLRNSQ